MSNQRNSNPRYGTGTVSGNLPRTGASGGPTSGPQPFQKGYGTGLVSLGTAKKPRTASTLPERKLSVPKPVNLPSLRKENAGNDPNTQLVPSGGVGGWQKPDSKDEQEEELVPNLTAGSSWASAPSASGVPSWQPPQPFPVATSGPQKARNLNPLEYPSLSAAATAAKQSGLPTQPVPHLPSSGSQGGSNWDEDERKPAFGQSKATTESWADSKVEDERGAVYRPPWEQNGHSRDRPSDEHWSRSSRPGFGTKAYDRFKEVDDPHLFPPPPPPRQPPPPPPRGADASRDEADAEKRAFEDEIDRVIEEERRREREATAAAAQEAARQKAIEEEEAALAEAAHAELAAAQAKLAAEAEAKPLTAADQQAALEAARQKALAARKRREAEDEEMENRRKAAAMAKLKELEDRMNARQKAEQEAKLAAASDAKSAEQALAEVHSVLAEAVESSAESAVTAAKVALGEEIQSTRDTDQEVGISLGGSSASRGDLASIQADAGSSVALSDQLSGVFKDASGTVSDSGSIHDYKVPDASWGARPGSAAPPKAIWQRRNKEGPELQDSAAIGSHLDNSSIHRPELGIQEPVKEDSGAAALFSSSSNFGPSLVATSLGISAEDLESSQQKAPETESKDRIHAAPSGPLNWRAVMGVKEPEEIESARFEESQGGRGDAGSSRGRGRGRRDRDRERLYREDSHESGGRGRGIRERGRARGRGRGRLNDQPPGMELSEQSDTLSHSTDSANVSEGRRNSRGRGRSRADSEGRGRGRGRGRESGPIAPPPPPPPPPPQAAAVPELKSESKPEMALDDDLPPGIFPSIKSPIYRGQDIDIGAPGLGHGTGDIDWTGQPSTREAILSSLPLSKPPAFDPPLDSFSTMKIESRHDKSYDRPVDRPKSAAGAVGQPISKLDTGLANGIPNLPHDLSLEVVPETSKPPTSSGISFGFQPSQTVDAGPPFPGVFFPDRQQSNPWQSRAPASAGEPNLEAAMQSLYKGGYSGADHPSPRQASQQQAASSGLQFGAFGAQSFPQFGQLNSVGFGQAPFIQTGKQPDWSTGPSLVNASQNAAAKSEGMSAQNSGPEFSRNVGMDTIVQPSSLNRGPQSAPGPPGPPGLQRQLPQSSQPPATAALPGDLFSNDHPVKSPPPPPGLQNAAGPQSFYNPNMTPRSFAQQQGQYGATNINVSFSAPQQQPQSRPFSFQGMFQDSGAQQFSQGPPPGIGKSGMTPRGQMPQFPDDVFDTSISPRVDPGFLPGPSSALNGNQQGGRRGPDNRGGRSGGRGPSRAPVPARGRGFGRLPNVQAGRGPVLQTNMAMLPSQALPHPGMPGLLGPPGTAAFPMPQGSMQPMTGYAPNHRPVGDQMQAQRLGSQSRGRGRMGLRSSHDGAPIPAGTFNDR